MASKLPESPVWLITGCSAGFGRALAERVLAHGHRCVVTARNVVQVEDIAAPYPDRALAIALDVTDPASRERAFAAAESRFGHVDILVNNAGWGYNCAIEEGEDEVVRAMFDANVFGLAAMMRRALPAMRARGFGHMVFVSSLSGKAATARASLYCATLVLDEIARLKRSHAIVAEINNPRISDRLMERWGWERHCLSWRGRHFIKRFYGVFPAIPAAWQARLRPDDRPRV